jgi:hypothetical protein
MFGFDYGRITRAKPIGQFLLIITLQAVGVPAQVIVHEG